MKILTRLLTAFAALSLMAGAANVSAQEAPDALVKRISQEVLDIAKADKEIQGGNQKRVLELVDAKVLPYVNFEHMTSLAASRYWREATPAQQKALIAEFRTLLVYTYSGAIAQVKDQTLEFKPLGGDATDTDVVVRSQVARAGGEPIQLNYRLEKLPGGWKIYDVNVLGAWLVETYKGNFSAEISKGGVDGLLATLKKKNEQLAAKTLRNGK